MRTDEQMDMKKPIVAFRNFVNAPENEFSSRTCKWCFSPLVLPYRSRVSTTLLSSGYCQTISRDKRSDSFEWPLTSVKFEVKNVCSHDVYLHRATCHHGVTLEQAQRLLRFKLAIFGGHPVSHFVITCYQQLQPCTRSILWWGSNKKKHHLLFVW
jgi:hypothetical protein